MPPPVLKKVIRRPSTTRKRRVNKDVKPPPQSITLQSSDEAPAKRKRMSVACLGCRARKVKCDGRKPRCYNCELYHDECTFVFHNDKRKPYPKEYIDALNTRITVLEDLLKTANIDFESVPGLPSVPKPPDEEDEEAPPTNKDYAADEYMDRLTDRVGQLSMTPTGLRYFGPTSNLHLLSSIVWTRRPSINIEQKGREAIQAAGLTYDVDPARRDHLLKLYWTWHHPFFNVTDRAIFERDMNLYNNGMTSQAKYYSPLLLNALLASGALLDDTCVDDAQYHLKARILLDIEVEDPKITTVQAAAVLGACEAVCDRDTRGWIYAGMASRMAVELGYHLNCDVWVKKNVISAEEAHMRKTTFWGCYVFDKLWSFYMGRPGSLRLGDVYVARPDEADSKNETETWIPYSSPDQKLPAIWTEYTAPAHLNITLVHLVKLIDMIAEIQEVMYSGSDGIGPELWLFASKMHVRLASWYTNLPPPVLCSLNSHKPVLSHIVVMHLQYHATLILLHRPFLKISGTDHNVLRIRRICRTAAIDISNLTEKYQMVWYGMRRINVISVYIFFTAATVHLLNIWNETGPHKVTAIRGLKICCKALSELGLAYETAKRTLAVLTCLASKGRSMLDNSEEGWNRTSNGEGAPIDKTWMPEQNMGDSGYQMVDHNLYQLRAAQQQQQQPQRTSPLEPTQQSQLPTLGSHTQPGSATSMGGNPFASNNFSRINSDSDWFSKTQISDNMDETGNGYDFGGMHQRQLRNGGPQPLQPDTPEEVKSPPSMARKAISDLLVLTTPGQFIGTQNFSRNMYETMAGPDPLITDGQAPPFSAPNRNSWDYVPIVKNEGQERYY